MIDDIDIVSAVVMNSNFCVADDIVEYITCICDLDRSIIIESVERVYKKGLLEKDEETGVFRLSVSGIDLLCSEK